METQKQLIYKLKGKDHLLVEKLITDSNMYDLHDKDNEFIKLGVIEQGIKKVKTGGLFGGSAYVVVTLLVPVDNLQKFHKVWEKE